MSVLLILTVSCLLWLPTVAWGGPCDIVLLQRNAVSEQMARETLVSWLQLIDEESFDLLKKNASAEAIYYGYFAGSYAEFKEKRSTALKLETFTGSDTEWRSILRSTLPDDAVDAWGKCVQNAAKAGGLFAWLEDVDFTSATLHFLWTPPPGSSTLRISNATIQGGSVQGAPDGQLIAPNKIVPTFLWNPYKFPAGDNRIVIRRSARSDPIRIAIDGQTGESNFSFSTKAYFPGQVDNPVEASLTAPVLLSDLRPTMPPPVYPYCNAPPGSGRLDKELVNLALLRWAVAKSSTNYPSPEHASKHLNDGYVTNCASWIPLDADMAPSATIDLVQKYWPKKLILRNGHADGRGSKSIVFDTSVDGKTFTPLSTWTGILAPNSPAEVAVSTDKPVRYVRFIVTDWERKGSIGPRIDEFEIYGDSRR